MRVLHACFHLVVALVVGWSAVVLGPFAWSARSVSAAVIGAVLLLSGPAILGGGTITWLVSPTRRVGLRAMALGAAACTAWALYVFASIAGSNSPRQSATPFVGGLLVFLLVLISDLAIGLLYRRTTQIQRGSIQDSRAHQ